MELVHTYAGGVVSTITIFFNNVSFLEHPSVHVFNVFPVDSDKGASPTSFQIFLGLASIPVALAIIGAIYMCKTNCSLMPNCCALSQDFEKEDINDTYGTYARGWDGEGEYGDGDKVYVTDSNTYYDS